MIKYQVDIRTLIDLKLGFEAYFVLYCLYEKNNDLMLSYIRSCKKINTEIFKELESNEYLKINYYKDDDKIYFDNLILLEKGKLIFKENQINSHSGSSELLATDESTVRNFDEFRNNYPKTIKKNGKILRRTHTNLKRCFRLYNEILKEGILHEDLCRCARLYIKEKKDTNSEEFIQLLETWLHKRIYEVYIDEIEHIIPREHNNFDTI